MQRRIILIVASIILATFAMLLIKVYLDRQTQIIESETKQNLAKRQESEAIVVVANADIPKGATITAEMLATQSLTRDNLQPQAVGSPERVIGMITLIPISRGEQITLNKLVSAKEATASGSSLAMLTPVGKRAITIQVDNIASLLGMIKAGDYVDVVAVVPVPVQNPSGGGMSQQPAVIPLFQNVLVLAVGREMGSSAQYDRRYQQQGQQAEASAPITLAIAPSEANLLAFVQEQGRIRLNLRSPADANIEPVTPASWDTVFQYMIMNNPQAQNKNPAGDGSIKPSGREVEIYRGLKKETLTVSQ
ncbi:MAG TPA: Flp pilus assembly protein CpaB [Candidatus Margulisiibacteriota bacterium]|nr:Flp pilus assembly protein CpaB [Candidatus Margulisiibacteriota bacterium]